ncbi:MAG TPA: hypothetical protein VIH51_11650, partial [Myxococcales bacterium]
GETVQWNAAFESQARGRDQPSSAGRAEVGELDLHARLGLSTQQADGTVALTWLPSVLLTQAVSGTPAGTGGNATQQGVRLELQTRPEPPTRLAFRSGFDWGLTDFSPLSGQVTPPVVGLLPSQRFVRTLAVEMNVDLTHAFSRRLQLSAVAGFQRSGGIGHEAVAALPIQVGPLATASLAWRADRLNFLTLSATGSYSRFSNGVTSALADLQPGWRCRATSHTLLDAGAGLALLRSTGPDLSSSGAYGSGTLGVTWELPLAPQEGLRSSARLRLAPGVDRLTALASQTFRGEASAELTEGRLLLAVAGSQAHTIAGAGAGADDLRLEARSSWSFARNWVLDGGVRAARTNQLTFSGWQAEVLVGVRWADRGSF